MNWKSGLSLVRVKPKTYSFGTLREAAPEERLDRLGFRVHKFNNRPRPAASHTAIFSCFSEFGSELVGSLYCIPRLLQGRYLGYYSVAMGWAGRAYLYKHLVDEFWELDPAHQWLREYCRAFHHDSRNLRRLERYSLDRHGRVVTANDFSVMTLNELYPNIAETKKTACWTPTPGPEAYAAVGKYLKPNSVGVTARFRECYGRNLQIEFYQKLLDQLRDAGYDPVWTGEQGTTYGCPDPSVTNFRDSPDAADLEKTLALTSKLQFTVQFWTASTRLAGLVGTPFLIFESPDQIYGAGHEGMRLNLCTRGRRKLVVSHFYSVRDDHAAGLDLVRRAVGEMTAGNWADIIGLVGCPGAVAALRLNNLSRIGDS